ncbi:MAG: 3-oxoacyl-[acyl-carrier-protein] reductase [Ignavibacteriales bacterium]|nr:3-oxoacyl-[acyl-carrier-protein] reductase [Ignavibacteriales bacterium]
MELKGKRAIVTGGSRGIGKAIVLELASKGCDVVFTYHNNQEAAKSVELEALAKGVKAFAFQADASLMSEAERTIQFTIENLGGLDILVNNAGITKDGLMLRMSEADFDSVISSNLKSVFNYTKVAIKPMIAQRYGKIVNIASVVGIIGNPGQANYVAAKAGVIGLTKSNARELAGRNICVNAVAPGFISTDMTAKLNEKQKEIVLTNVPIKREGKPEEVAHTVLFLCSSNSDYITGQVISVDGGMTM